MTENTFLRLEMGTDLRYRVAGAGVRPVKVPTAGVAGGRPVLPSRDFLILEDCDLGRENCPG
jgi:hypothetical protein